MGSIFDDVIFDEEDLFNEQDSLGESTLRGMGIPEMRSLDEYLQVGVISRGDLILAPPAQKEMNINNHTIRIIEPGFVKILNDLFGNPIQCHASVTTIDLQIPSFLYELNTYAQEEIELGKDLFGDATEEWLVAKHHVTNLEDYRSFSARLLDDNNKARFAMFAYCSVLDVNGTKIDDNDAALRFLGIYEVDKDASLFHRRIVFHLLSTEYHFGYLS